MQIHLILKPLHNTTTTPIFSRNMYSQSSYSNANLQSQILEHISSWDHKCDERVSKKLLDNTWVLTFGGPLWNFLNKFCTQNTHEQKTFNICNKTINHSSYKEKGPLHSKKTLRWKLRMDTQFSLKLTMDSGYSLTFKESRNGRKASEGSSSKSRCT